MPRITHAIGPLRYKLDIILPCYNPLPDWSAGVVLAFQQIQLSLGDDVQLHLILVNDGSKQGLLEKDIAVLKAAIPTLSLVQYPQNRGKGHALRQGVAVAEGDFQIYTDIDFPYTVASLLSIFQALQAGEADIVAGVRGQDYYGHVPAIRKLISQVLRWFLRNLLRLGVHDTQAGLKGFNALGRKLFLRTKIDRFLFDLEFVHLASKTPHTRLVGIPIHLREGIQFSKARLGILLQESWNFTRIVMGWQ